MLVSIKTGLLFILSSMICMISAGQSNIKPSYQEVNIEQYRSQLQKEETIRHNRSLKPDNLSSKFAPQMDQDYVLSSLSNDEEKKARLRELYAVKAKEQFNDHLSTGLLAVVAVTLLITYVNRKRSAFPVIGIALLLSFTAYLATAYAGGNFADFQLYIGVSSISVLLVVAVIALVNYLSLKVFRNVSEIQIAQKIIICVGVTIAMLIATNFLNSYTTQTDDSLFNIREHRANWLSCSFIILMLLYVLFEKDELQKQVSKE